MDRFLSQHENRVMPSSAIEPNRSVLIPTPEEFATLSPFERLAFRVTHRMNRGAWKRF